MRVVRFAVLFAACAAAPPPRPLTPMLLRSGHYEAELLRPLGEHDVRLAPSAWSVDIDRDALRLELHGPAGSETRGLARVDDGGQPWGCPYARQETFAVSGALEIAGQRFPEPIVLADCGFDGVTVYDHTLTRGNAGPLAAFTINGMLFR